MNGPKLRLLLKDAHYVESQGARRAFDRFASIQGGNGTAKALLYDISSHPEDGGLDAVRASGYHRRLLAHPADLVLDIDSHTFLAAEHGAPLDEVRRMTHGIIGISLIDNPLRLHDGEAGMAENEPVGLGRYRLGALVSVCELRKKLFFHGGVYPHPDFAELVYDVAVARELARVFIEVFGNTPASRDEHDCWRRSCIMQKVISLAELLHIADQKFGFCVDCAAEIARETELLARE